MKKIKIMKSIDVFLFNQIDNLAKNSEFQKITDAYANLDEKLQEALKVILMIITIALPLFIFLVFFSINNSKKQDIEIKEKLINTANSLIQKQSLLKSSERKILSSKYIESERGLKSSIDNSLRQISVESSKVQVNNFESKDMEGLITKVKADISFKGLTSADIHALFNSLNAKLKIKMDEISIKKNEITNSLDGVITMNYYSKDNSVEE